MDTKVVILLAFSCSLVLMGANDYIFFKLFGNLTSSLDFAE